MDISRVISEASIQSVLIQERYYRDTCQWDKLRSSYHPDARKTSICISWYKGDIDGFVSGSKEMASRGSQSRHTIIPVEIDINGDKAFSVSLGSIVARFMKENIEYELSSACRMLSRLENLGTVERPDWKLLTLEAIYVDDSIIPVIPQPLSGFDTGDPGNGTRKSYRCLSFLLAEKGHKVNNDLPGVDNPQSVEDVLRRNQEWLLNSV